MTTLMRPLDGLAKRGRAGRLTNFLVHPRLHTGVDSVLNSRQERLDNLVLMVDAKLLPGLYCHSELFVDIY